MKENSKNFLQKYLNNPAPTGFEAALGGQQIWLDYITPYANHTYLDIYGTAVAVLGNMDSKYKVVIEAHADEIGWYVSYIDDDGYIRVVNNGGSDNLITPSMRVNLWTKNGPITGIFGHPAVHIQDKDLKINLESMFIDVGSSSKKKTLALGIEVGTPITFQDSYLELGEDWITSRALDNKIGGFMIAEVARKIFEKEISLPYQLHIVNAVQEEIGFKGAKMIASNIKPDVAIVLDVCHDTQSPCYDIIKQGDFKASKGLVLSVAPSVHNNLLRFIRETLDDNSLPYQLSAGDYTGTDTDVFAYTGSGIPSCLISLPIKYMHTTVETCAKIDVKNIIKSLVIILTNLKENQSFAYKQKI